MTDEKMMALHEKLQQAVPMAIDKALSSYDEFVRMEQWEDARSFAAYHSGCKAALAHLDYLTKLVKWVREHQKDDVKKNDYEHLQGLINQAQKTIQSHDKKYKSQS